MSNKFDYRAACDVLKACKPAIDRLQVHGLNASLSKQMQAAITAFEVVFNSTSEGELKALASAAGLWEADLTTLISKHSLNLVKELWAIEI